MSYVTKIGHAHLKVRDLARSVAFYSRYLALHETERVGDAFAFLTGGAFHHEIALQRVGMRRSRLLTARASTMSPSRFQIAGHSPQRIRRSQRAASPWHWWITTSAGRCTSTILTAMGSKSTGTRAVSRTGDRTGVAKTRRSAPRPWWRRWWSSWCGGATGQGKD